MSRLRRWTTPPAPGCLPPSPREHPANSRTWSRTISMAVSASSLSSSSMTSLGTISTAVSASSLSSSSMSSLGTCWRTISKTVSSSSSLPQLHVPGARGQRAGRLAGPPDRRLHHRQEPLRRAHYVSKHSTSSLNIFFTSYQYSVSKAVLYKHV